MLIGLDQLFKFAEFASFVGFSLVVLEHYSVYELFLASCIVKKQLLFFVSTALASAKSLNFVLNSGRSSIRYHFQIALIKEIYSIHLDLYCYS